MNQDFRDLLAEFNAHGVEYLVVGAHALAVHGYVRATKDLDVWIRPELGNARRVIAALAAFGAPLHDLTEADLASPGTMFADQLVSILSRDDLLRNKRASGREQDLLDVKWLERHPPK
jgi:hypothetical protein